MTYHFRKQKIAIELSKIHFSKCIRFEIGLHRNLHICLLISVWFSFCTLKCYQKRTNRNIILCGRKSRVRENLFDTLSCASIKKPLIQILRMKIYIFIVYVFVFLFEMSMSKQELVSKLLLFPLFSSIYVLQKEIFLKFVLVYSDTCLLFYFFFFKRHVPITNYTSWIETTETADSGRDFEFIVNDSQWLDHFALTHTSTRRESSVATTAFLFV